MFSLCGDSGYVLNSFVYLGKNGEGNVDCRQQATVYLERRDDVARTRTNT